MRLIDANKLCTHLADLQILRRYVEDGGNHDDVYVERNGEKLMYSDLVKQVEGENE